MIHHLLDAGGAALIFIGLFFVIAFVIAAIFIEALFINLSMHNPWKKALGQSALINAASLVVGLLIIATGSDWFHLGDWKGFLAFYLLTMVVEGPILYYMNKDKPVVRTLITCLVMNLISYGLLSIFSGGEF